MADGDPPSDATPSKRRRLEEEEGKGGAAGAPPPAPTDPPTPSPDAAVVGAYMQREAFLAAREAEGELAFEYVRNDGDDVNSMWLIGLKHVYSRQLPNMPKEYITRLVFDRRHASVAIVRRDGGVVGGITYRVFARQRLGEIAFCAVSANEQVKGYGARLMNHAKAAAAARDGVTHFLTYADNNAVGYFAKQGFTKAVSLDPARWKGYIKDYDGGTLMECVLDARVPYAALPAFLSAARAAVDARVRAVSRSHVVHAGLDHFKGGGAGGGRPPPLPPLDVPGVAAAGWAAAAAAEPVPSLLVGKAWLRADAPGAAASFAASLLADLAGHDDAWPFGAAVDARDVPDYYTVVKDPMDFATLKERVAAFDAHYAAVDGFVADVRRVFANARLYNAADTVYAKCATRMEAALDGLLASRVTFGAG
jgi:histone acetyltransferase